MPPFQSYQYRFLELSKKKLSKILKWGDIILLDLNQSIQVKAQIVQKSSSYVVT